MCVFYVSVYMCLVKPLYLFVRVRTQLQLEKTILESEATYDNPRACREQTPQTAQRQPGREG